MSKLIVVAGRRKTAIAKVRVMGGSGAVLYNNMPYQNLGDFHKLAIDEPIEIYRKVLGDFKLDIKVRTRGGGKESQVEAARLGIAKALVRFTKSEKLKKAYLEYDRNMIVADTRRKETYKPGDSKARAKRQTSFR